MGKVRILGLLLVDEDGNYTFVPIQATKRKQKPIPVADEPGGIEESLTPIELKAEVEHQKKPKDLDAILKKQKADES